MRIFHPVPANRYFIGVFLFVCVLFIAFTWIIYRHHNETHRLNKEALYQYEVNRQGRRILTDLLNMETGVRGYFITSKEDFLTPYEQSRQTLITHTQALVDYTRHDPTAAHHLDDWIERINRFSDTLHVQVQDFRTHRDRGKFAANLEWQKQEMDALRALLDRATEKQGHDLESRLVVSSHDQHSFEFVLFTAASLAIGGMLLATVVVVALMHRNQKSQDQARQLEQRLQFVINGINDGVYDLNLSDGSIYFSDMYKRMLGYTDEEFPNTIDAAVALLHPEDHAKTLDVVQRYLKGECHEYTNIFRMRHKDGRWVWIMSRGVAFKDAAGKVTHLMGTHTDITDQKMREQELQQLNAEMETFAYITSHDLRAPLINLKGFAGELTRAIASITPILEKAQACLSMDERATLHHYLHQNMPESLQFIQQAVAKMDGLTAAVLDLSRIGRREFHVLPVDMNALVKRCLDSQAFEISQRRIQVHCEPLPEVMSDPVALEQILGNLLDNAIKYLQPEREGRITFTATQEFGYTQIAVHDNGRGIPAIDQEKVFQIFRRARNAQEVRGMGMGMSYVQATIRRLGGSIAFDSVEGEGTTFYIKIPHKTPPLATSHVAENHPL